MIVLPAAASMICPSMMILGMSVLRGSNSDVKRPRIGQTYENSLSSYASFRFYYLAVMKNTRVLASLVGVALLTLALNPAQAQVSRNYLPLSLSILAPGQTLADTVGVKPGLGFSLGYQYAIDRQWRLGAKGTWMWSKLSATDYGDYSQYAATYYQILATVTWRVFKHGWSPYLQAEGGLGFLNLDEVVANMPIRVEGASSVRGAIGGSVGLLIPLSETVDIDVAGRYSYAFISDGYSVAGVHAGVIYQLNQ